MANTAEIHIKLTGTQAKTIEARAVALNKLAVSVDQLSRVARQFPAVSTAANNFAKGIQKAGGAAESMGKRVKSAGNYLDNFGNLFSRMIRIMAAFTIITTVTRAFRELVTILIKAPAQMELWNAQLRTLTGSAGVAAQKLDLLKRVAIETPLELPDLFQGLTTLKAFNVEMSERTLPLIADLAAVSGRTFQDVSEVVGKVIQGSATAITRSLPTLGINYQEFRALADQLGSRAEALFTIIEGRFRGFAAESAKTTLGIVSNIKDAVFVIASDVGQGLLSAFQPTVKAIFDYLNRLREDPIALENLRERLFGIGQGMVEASKRTYELAINLKDLIATVARAVDSVGGLQTVMAVFLGGKIFAAITAITGALAGLSRALKYIMILLVRGRSVFAVLGTLLAGTTAPAWATLATVVASAGGAVLLTKKLFGESSDDLDDVGSSANYAADQLAKVVDQIDNLGVTMADVSAASDSVKNISLELSRLTFIGSENFKMLPGRDQDAELKKFIRGLIDGLFSGPGLEPERGALGAFLNTQGFEARFAQLNEFLQNYRDKLMGVVKASEEAQTAIQEYAIGSTVITGGDEFENLIQARRNAFTILELSRKQDLVSENDYYLKLKDIIAQNSALVRDVLSPEAIPFLDESERAKFGQALQSLVDEVNKALETVVYSFGEISERTFEGFQPFATLFDRSWIADQAQVLISDTRTVLIGMMEQIKQDMESVDLKLKLGEIDESAFDQQMAAIRSRIVNLIDAMTKDPTLHAKREELRSWLLNFSDEISPMANALADALVRSIETAANALADAIGMMISPLQDESITDSLKTALAAILTFIGDSLIQAGVGALGLQALLQNFLNPVTAAAAIAAGVALKGFAKSISNTISSRTTSASTSAASTFAPQAVATGPIDFGTFTPQAQGSVVNFTINTIDSQGVAEFVKKNADELGRAVVHVAERDRATSGGAFGVFTPSYGV